MKRLQIFLQAFPSIFLVGGGGGGGEGLVSLPVIVLLQIPLILCPLTVQSLL